jgi:hypothetical protein
MSRGFKAGLGSMRKQIGNMAGQFTSKLKGALTLGGALGSGALIKDAIDAQPAYLQLADALSTFSGEAMDAADVEKLIADVADETKVPINELIGTLSQLSSSAGRVDMAKLLERASSQARRLGHNGEFIGRVYTRLVAKGVADTAEEAENLTEQFNTLFRRMLGVDLDEAIAPADVAELAGFINTTGNSAAEMLKLISLGGENIAKDFGKANEIVEELGLSLKQSKGVDEMTKKLKLPKGAIDSNRSALENMLAIADRGPKKFAAMADALAGDIAGQAMKEMIGEEFLVLASRGKVGKKDWELRVKKLKDQLSDLGDLVVDRQKLEGQDARHKKTASASIDDALNKVKIAFSKPEMIDGIDRLAQHLPAFASGVADLVDWISKNPWKAVAAGVGIKLGAGFASGMAASIAKQIAGAIGGAGTAGAAGAAGASGAGAAGAAGAGAAGAGLLAVGGAITAGAAVGVGTGLALNHFVFDPHSQSYADKLRSARGMGSLLTEASQKGSTAKHKLRLIEEVKAAKTALGTGRYTTENMMGELAAVFTDVKAPSDDIKEVMANLNKTQIALMTMLQDQLKEGKQATKNTTEFSDALRAAGTGLRQFVPNGASGRGLNSLPNKPGADPVSG